MSGLGYVDTKCKHKESERERLNSNTLKKEKKTSDRLERKMKDEILTSLKEWKNEREAWSNMSGLKYANIECKHTQSEKEVKF